jgi:hypothetical protein
MQNAKYQFYLNPHDEYAWTKCPNCDTKTNVKKFCLMIHCKILPDHSNRMFSLLKSCKFCTKCQLIIAKKSEIENLLEQMIDSNGMKFQKDEYFIFGTMERKDWLEGQKKPLNPSAALDMASPFKQVLQFDIRPAGWYFTGDKKE